LSDPISQFEQLYGQHIYYNFLDGTPGGLGNQADFRGTTPTKKNADHTNSIAFLFEVLQNEEVLDFLQEIHKIMLPIYQLYANEANLLTPGQFFALFRDFGLFPDILSKTKLESIFETLAHIHSQNEQAEGHFSAGKLLIDEHLFVESLLFIGRECTFSLPKEPSLIQKVTYLIDLMNESKGPDKWQVSHGFRKHPDLLRNLRKKHPAYFLT
jgi:hypothetical protein